MGKKVQKNKVANIAAISSEENVSLPPQRNSHEEILKKEKWINKQRVLVFAARGIGHRDRHLMKDLKSLMPHHRPESKIERTKTLSVINEICEMKHCNKAVLFEGRRKRDLYMWISNVPIGPSVKFLVENVHTMAELKLTGNCLRGSRPLLSFDDKFNHIPYLRLLKELLIQVFGVPNYHPKSQPFIDHIYTFTYIDRRIWFRNFQILSEDGGLAEIGPRFVLNPVKIFEGSFTGNSLWENIDYVSPAKQRQMLKKAAKERYVNRVEQKVHQEATRPKNSYEGIEYEEIFDDKHIRATAKILAAKAKAKALNKTDHFDSKRTALNNKIKNKQMTAVKNLILKRKTAKREKSTKTI